MNKSKSEMLRVGDRVEIIMPTHWGKGTITEVHMIGERVVSYQVRRDAGTTMVLRPTDVRKL